MAKIKAEKEAPSNGDAGRLASILKDRKDDHYNFEDTVKWKFSTGSLILDSATGGGITPSLVRLCGPFNSGKSAFALDLVRNFMATVPNSKAFWILAEGRLSDENKERSGLTFVTDPEKWKDGTVFVLESNIYELIVDSIKELTTNNEEDKRYCFIIDSMDGLILKKDRDERGIEAGKVAGPQLITKKLLQALGLGMFKRGHLAIAVSQVSSDIKIDPYAKTANRGGMFSGGNALLHWADFIFEYLPSNQADFIFDSPDGKFGDKKGSKTIGKWAKVVLQKSTIETTRRHTFSYPIKFGKKPCAIWSEYEIIDSILMYDLAKAKGAWITIDDSLIEGAKKVNIEIDKQYNGKDDLRKSLEENPKLTEYLFEKIKVLIS